LLKFQFNSATQLDAFYIQKASATELFAATAASLKVQGSNDNSTWTDLTAAIALPANATNVTINGGISLTNSNKFTLTTNLAKYSYYRILGVAAGNILAGQAIELYFDINTSSFQSSLYPKPNCANDLDKDGKPNHLDLDSDGDNCADAIEAGSSTIATSTTVYPTGSDANTNGLLNNYEGTTDGTVKYSSTYSEYALIKNINACIDTDGDSIKDVFDLDDDNDGVLDTDEFNCTPSIMSKTGVSVSSTVTWGSTLANILDGAESIAAYTTTTFLNQTILQFDLPAAKVLSLIELSSQAGNFPLGSTGTYNIEGWNGTTWSTIAANQVFGTSAPITGTSNSYKFNMLDNYKSYSKYRIFGTSASGTVSGWVQEAYFTERSCNPDVDGDGIPNSLELDSDNDGCADAIEAGSSTTATSTTVYLTGTDTNTNGLLNNYEGTTAGKINYNSTYSNYAVNNTINGCTDTDGDRITDVFDIDDDNDGVVDNAEENCSTKETWTECTATQLSSNGYGIFTHCSGWNSYDFDLGDGVSRSDFDYMGLINGVPEFDLQGSYTSPIGGKIYKTYKTIPGSTYTFNIFLKSSFADVGTVKPYLKGVDNLTGTELASTYLNGTGLRSVTFIATSNSTNLTLGYDSRVQVGSNQFWYEAGATQNGAGFFNCQPTDTDKDGIPNRLDLDSDGDGCADAIEASSSKTAKSITVYPTGSDANTNGLLNNYESTTAGIVNYTSTYLDFALVNTLNACIDTDGDSIADVKDIDDDNDGVLDTVELPCEIQIVNKTGVIITKPSTINYSFNGSSTVNNLIDDVDNNNYILNGPTGALNDEWFRFQFPTAKIINYLEIGHYQGQTLFSTSTTYRVEGSNNGNDWKDVSGTLTYNNNAVSTSGGLSSFNSSVANFNNNTAYSYYRLVGINAASGGAWATEIYFKEQVCQVDFDKDGIPNNLDLDSDGDGCADAIEAGSSKIATSISVYPTGTDTNENGLLNNYEGTTAGTVKYSSTYSEYALNKNINACLDSDSDGITNVFDIDDDNDGVLDSVESPCMASLPIFQPTSVGVLANVPSLNTSITYKTISGAVPTKLASQALAYGNYDVLQFAGASAFSVEFSNPLANLDFTLADLDLSEAVYYEIFDKNNNLVRLTSENIQFKGSGVNFIPGTTNSGSFTTGSGDSPTNSTVNYVRVKFDSEIQIKTIKVYKTAGANNTWFTLNGACNLIDTDGDGIPNRLDLDSDGDNCSDAIEANSSTTATSTSSHPIGTDTNENGLLNNYEGTTAGTIKYSSTYSEYALNKNINACLDSDSDGVNDVFDIDDDNDGVLDSIENGPYSCALSPSCVVNASLSATTSATGTAPTGWTNFGNGGSVDINQGNWQISYGQATPSSVLFPSSNANTFFIYGMSKGGAGSAGSWAPYGESFQQTLNCLTVGTTYHISFRGAITHSPGVNAAVTYETTPTVARFVLLKDGELASQAPDQLLEATQRTVNLSFVATATSHTIAIAHTNDKDTDLSLMVIEAGSGYFCTSSPAAFNETLDTDGDGIPNRLDLDSDGDGCSDAIEAASSKTATSTSAFPTGTDTNSNGLLNNYESATAGLINYTSSYSEYALDKTINACLDTDKDGVADVRDIDDDNDGVLDIAEQINCVSSGVDLSKVTFSGSSITARTANSFTTAGGSAWKSSYSVESFKLPISLKFNHASTTGYEMFGLIPVGTAQTPDSWTDNGYKFYGTGTTLYGYFLTQWDPSALAILPTDVLSIDISTSGLVTVGVNGVTRKVFQGAVSDYKLALSSYTPSSLTNIILTDASNSVKLTCKDTDTDGDGIPNRLDLDSDGDNCADAIESGTAALGTTAASTTSFLDPSTTGLNGFANNLETATDSGVYKGAYSYNFAISTALNGCTDTDGDGKSDLIDIDDDNDGVLDSQESTCASSLMPKAGITVSSPVTWTYANGATSLNALVDGVDAQIFVANTNASFTNAPILQFDLPKPTILTQIELGNYPSQTPLNAGGMFKMQGWDGTQWGDIGIEQVIANTAPINATNNSIKFNMVHNLIAFSKYRIFGVSAVGSGVWAQEAYFTQKTCTDMDTDGDGKPNRLDLDSDGDACSDATEANSSSTAKSLTEYPTGTDANKNGLNDNYELSTLGGSYNYTSSYSDYALLSSIKGCLDTDGDGITDFNDIDDDNDGILDSAEMIACNTMWTPGAAIASPNYGTSTASLTFNNSGLIGTGLSATLTVPNTLDDTYFLLEPRTTGFIEYTLPANTNVGGVVLWAPDAFNYGGGDGPVKDFKVEVIYNNVVTFTSQTFTTAQPIGAGSNAGAQVFYLPKTFVNPQRIRLNISSGWYDVNNNNTIQVGTETLAAGSINGAYNMTLGEFKVICGPIDIDTDSDGIPNRLDLDSDGDGCSDAYEAGSVTAPSSTTAFPVATNNDTNSNGLLNNYEGTTAGTIKYTSTYTNYSLDKTINLCTDTDGDGIGDFFDIDNDNDGVLDAVESPSCFLSANEWNTANKVYFAKFSSELTAATPNNNFAALGDGNATTAAVQLQASQGQLNKELFKMELMKPTQLDAIYIKKTTATEIFGTTAASLKVQGSNDNSSWTDLTAAIALPADATNVTANGAVSLTNSNKFTLTTNPGAYKYFRIYGVATSNTVGGFASEIYFDVNTTAYNASRYPKATCISDTDNDGQPNHLDLDSDGDGCSDAKEAGTTTSITANFKFTANFGTNGFADALETTADNGVYSGTYTYTNYAIDKTLNACLDTDADGVPDVADIDDDNDGVLDLTECPQLAISNKYKVYTFNRRNDVNVSTNLPVRITGSSITNVILNQLTEGTFSYNGVTWALLASDITANASQQIKIETLPTAGVNGSYYFADAMLITNGTDTYLINDRDAGFSKVGTWIDQASFAGNYLSNMFYANINAANIATWTFSNITSPDILCDADNDGILNHLDLDSDNDGCADAIEAGSSKTATSTTVFPATSGTTDTNKNGLLNNYEGTTAGTVNYTSTYSNYALDKSLNFCTDTDADGVSDLIDIDDDNDGVLDTVECPMKNILVNGTFTGGTTGWTAHPNWLYELAGYVWNNSENRTNDQISQSFAKPNLNPAKSTVDVTFDVNANGHGWVITTAATAKLDLLINNTIYATISNPNGGTTASVLAANGATVNVNSIAITAQSVPSAKIIVSIPKTAFLNTNTIAFNFTSTSDDFSIDNVSLESFNACDTDNDGIINSLDLDSDGDGCSDAIEASSSTTASSTSVYPTGDDTNKNGLLNNYEGTTAGTVNYTSTYASYALEKTLNFCIDTDADGVPDLKDLDDDNDGIYDTVECAAQICPSPILNGSFESNTVAANNWTLVNSSSVLGWKTTATDNLIELWGTGFNSVPAANGVVFAEINGTQSNTILYQKLCITPGSVIEWSVKHRGRDGVEVADVQIGASLTSLITQKSMSDGTTAWGTHTGTYVIPATQQETYIGFKAIIPAVGSGNFIDDLTVIVKSAGQCTLDTDGDGIINTLDTDSDNDGCPDANEYYNTSTAIGTDGNNYYGTGNPPAVNTNGTVSTANYTGSYTNVSTAGSASVITTQPTDQKALVNGNAVFTTALSLGSGTTTYQWAVSTNGGSTWTNLSNTGVYSGATTASLTLTGVTSAMNEYRYRLQVSQSNFVCGNLTSNAARLTIGFLPTIVDDNFAVLEDTPLTASVFTNDSGSAG
ncbi:hypothetical protein, partial [Daejeonella sp.]|uniref:hypothetical protein n=1 Tax=Daejeonella sp. TaxID=2805397 RepID=UPI0037BFD915